MSTDCLIRSLRLHRLFRSALSLPVGDGVEILLGDLEIHLALGCGISVSRALDITVFTRPTPTALRRLGALWLESLQQGTHRLYALIAPTRRSLCGSGCLLERRELHLFGLDRLGHLEHHLVDLVLGILETLNLELLRLSAEGLAGPVRERYHGAALLHLAAVAAVCLLRVLALPFAFAAGSVCVLVARAGGQDLVEVFERFVKQLLLVDPGDDLATVAHHLLLGLGPTVGVQTEVMVQRLGLLAAAGVVVQPDGDLELAPSRLVDDEALLALGRGLALILLMNGLGVDGAQVVGDGFVQLKLNPSQPVEDVGVVDALHEHLPRVCVVCGDARRSNVVGIVEGSRRSTVDEGSVDLHAFDAFTGRRRHDEE